MHVVPQVHLCSTCQLCQRRAVPPGVNQPSLRFAASRPFGQTGGRRKKRHRTEQPRVCRLGATIRTEAGRLGEFFEDQQPSNGNEPTHDAHDGFGVYVLAHREKLCLSIPQRLRLTYLLIHLLTVK